MAILLSDLLEKIGVSIDNANVVMEQTALEQYVRMGYQKAQTMENGGQESYEPLTFNIAFPMGKELHEIPVSALLHNRTMRLEQVDIKLKYKLKERDGELYVDLKSENAEDENLDEMTLSFRNNSASEGIARITDHHLKEI